MEKKIIPISPGMWAKKKEISRQAAWLMLKKHEEKGTIPEGVERVERVGNRWIVYVDGKC